MARKAKKKTSKTKKKKTVRKKKPAKVVAPVKSIVRQSRRALNIRRDDYNRKKLNLVLVNLTFFIVLFVVSAIFYSVSTTAFYISLFFMLSLIMGVISIALLIVLLIFVFLKFAK
jgi:hypothetical protein